MGQFTHLPPGAARHRSRGFTMMELIVTLSIVAILSAVAVPAMREFSLRANVSATTNDIVVALNLARSEAVKRGRNVSVVSTGGSWTAGWSVQTDAGVVLVQHAAVATDYSVLGAASGAGAPADRVIFTPTGGLSVATAYDFSICRPSADVDNLLSRRVAVSATGLIRSRRDTTSAPAGSCT